MDHTCHISRHLEQQQRGYWNVWRPRHNAEVFARLQEQRENRMRGVEKRLVARPCDGRSLLSVGVGELTKAERSVGQTTWAQLADSTAKIQKSPNESVMRTSSGRAGKNERTVWWTLPSPMLKATRMTTYSSTTWIGGHNSTFSATTLPNDSSDTYMPTTYRLYGGREQKHGCAS